MAEPPITLRAVHDSGPGNLVPTRVVIHATNPNLGFPTASAAGKAHATAVYFQEQGAGGSAHYVVDVVAEEHCVPDAVVAWHAPPNPHSIGIEICADGGSAAAAPKGYTRAQWLDPQVWPALARAAARTAELCARFAIPMTQIGAADLKAGAKGICGHADVSVAFGQSTHSDPGPNFPWPEFMAEVRKHSPAAPAPAAPPEEDMTFQVIPLALPAGTVAQKIVVPVGSAVSAAVVQGWFSFACDGQITQFEIWWQNDHGGIGSATTPAYVKGNAGKDARPVFDIPDGTTQFVFHYTATGPVGATIEIKAKNL